MHPPAPDTDDPLIGSQIGSYHVRRKLGEGGMGAVYELYHPGIDRRMALKVLHAEFSRNNDIVQRFFDEARAANVIRHPNIIDITDLNQLPGGGYYIQMEFLEGESLADLIERSGSLTPLEVARICIPICDALYAAHEAGIVHRDLKPDNVQLVPQPGNPRFVKVLDFGIAKLAAHLKRGGPDTISNVIMGTPDFMAPEQAFGRTRVIDHRADIYALGVIMYRMLSGRLPFRAPSIGDLIAMHLHHHEIPPLATLRPDLPPVWSQLIHRCMAQDMNNRMQSMAEVRQVLEQAAPNYHLRAPTDTSPYPPLSTGGHRPLMDPEKQPVGAAPSAVPFAAHNPQARPRRWFLPIALSVIALATAAIVTVIVVRSQASSGSAPTAAGSADAGPADAAVASGQIPIDGAPAIDTSDKNTAIDAGPRPDAARKKKPVKRPRARLWVTARPYAKIYVNGSYKGITDKTVKIPANQRVKIELRSPDGPEKRTFYKTLKPGQKDNIRWIQR